MPATPQRRPWIARRSGPGAAGALAAIALVAAAALSPPAAGRPPVSQSQSAVVLIGNLVDFALEAPPVTSVRLSFEVRTTDAQAELFTLKIFNAGPAGPPPGTELAEPQLLSEQTIVVDGRDPLHKDQIWIDQPPRPMQWLLVELEEPVEAASGRLLFALEMTLDQLAPESGLRPFLKPEPSTDHRTYLSEDGGSTWSLLDQALLDCLLNGACPVGSTDLKIEIQPC